MAMLTGLDHVLLAVRDLDGARQSYEALLGRHPSWEGHHPDTGTANVLFRLENTYLELLSPQGPGAVAEVVRAHLDEHGEGLFGLALATDDIEDCRRTLEERGLATGPVEAGHGRNRSDGRERRWRRVLLSPDQTRGIVVFPIQHDSPADALPLADAQGDPRACVHALDHVVVQTTRCDAAIAFFGETLGIRLALDREFQDWGVRLLFFRVGGVTIEVAGTLAGADSSAALPGGTADVESDRLYGMSYRVPDVDAAQKRLRQAGLDVSEIRRGRRPGTRVCTVRSGTCGVPTLLLQIDQDHASKKNEN